VRTALGAGRARLLRQLLTESVLIALAGGVVGYALVHAGVRVLVALAPPELPRLDEVAPDASVLFFTAAVSLLAGLLVGAAPAVAAGRSDVQGALKDGARGIAGGGLRRRLRGPLVVGEMALAVVLTIGAGLLLRSFVTLLDVDPGFRAENLLTLQVTLPSRINTPDARRAFYRDLFARLESLPGVTASGGTTRLPLGSTNVSTRVAIEGRSTSPSDMSEVEFRRAVHDYFRAMGIPVIRGRAFTEADGAGSAGVVVINQTMARKLWPNEDPVGKRVRMGPNPQAPWSTIIGVVGDLRHAGLDVEPSPELYIYYLQNPPVAPFIVLRTQGDPAVLADTVRAELKTLEKDLAVYDMRTMTEIRSSSVAQRQFIMMLALAFGLLALTLAAVGVYGVMALVVSERTREMGIRLALGAEPLQVLGIVVRQGLALAAIGIAAGFVAALLLTPMMANQLYGIGATDPVTLAGVPAVLLAVALMACVVPARRAMRVDPVTALRYE
jgi:predicted permease